MTTNSNLTFLGVLAAPTADGPRAAAVALSGAVELYHLINAGLDMKHPAVTDWLWSAGINPIEAADSLPASPLIGEVLIPQIGPHALVIHHGDMEIPFVAELATRLAEAGNPPIISGIDLKGTIEQAENGTAGRRARALQTRYEKALALARAEPIIHRISGQTNDSGHLTQLSVEGPFAKQTYSLTSEQDALFAIASIMHLGDLACFSIEPSPASPAIQELVNHHGLQAKFV